MHFPLRFFGRDLMAIDISNYDKLSPMMQHYLTLKEDYSDSILMYRLGDFYEMFFDDAILASKELELTLTGRNCGMAERAAMCGVPHHAVDSYIARLVKAGHKVAVCDQLETAAEAKGLVKRDVTRIYTPGTMDASESDSSDNNIYIASACIRDNNVGLAVADISTGELSVSNFIDEDLSSLVTEITIKGIRELIIDDSCENRVSSAFSSLGNDGGSKVYIDTLAESYFRYEPCRDIIQSHFNVTSLLPLDLDGHVEMVCAIGALLSYLVDTQKREPNQIKTLTIRHRGDYMQLDRHAMRNLELLETIYDGNIKGSLLGVLGKTKTAMGGRLLKQWIREPLKNPDQINRRLDSVDELRNSPIIANNITNLLRAIYDFERLTARIASGRANARDLIALQSSLEHLPEIKSLLANFDSELLEEIRSDISEFDELYRLIDSAIAEEPPLAITDGWIIKKGYSKELDELTDSISGAKSWIASLEGVEKERTGIKTLKVGYNKVFGYYIDVSRGMVDKVPEDYIRKQTLVNNERYITPELKEKESIVFTAEAKINKLEYDEFCKIRNYASEYIRPLQTASRAIAALDVLISFARVAASNGYVKPVIDDGDIIDIKQGRHSAVEQLLGAGVFVANDTYMNLDDSSELIITGPNMSGKSTYMRQTAIIVLMAQIGSFVPAEYARIGVVDRIFTRIGASDNLSYGQSTFYVEMSELAGILRNATSRSLILLDEIGRGTSTYDGLSIAWATALYLANPKRKIRTMFATHYHELTELAATSHGIKNLSVAVADDGSNIVFLHNIVEGPASKSYGIHVARLAGVPDEIRVNARAKLRELEAGEKADTFSSRTTHDSYEGIQLSLLANISDFSEQSGDAGAKLEAYEGKLLTYRGIIDSLDDLNINNMTPLAALNTLQEIIDEVAKARKEGLIDD